MSQNPFASLWSLDPTVSYLNHGSFGAVPRQVGAMQSDLQSRALTNPNRWFRFELPDLLIAARQSTASWLGVAEELFAFVPNSSQGMATAVQALVDDANSSRRPPHIVATSFGYGGVELALQRVARRSNATLSIVTLAYPHEVTADLIASRIAAAMPTSGSQSIVVLDQITSDTGMLLPVDEVIARLKSDDPNLQIVIDGAHAAGMLEFPLPTGFDVWVGNFHKWLGAPRPAAGIVCANSRIAAMMAPLAPSWDYEEGFPKSFDWQGTNDYSSYLATPTAIEFQQQWSFSECDSHNRSVVDGGATLLRDAWGVEHHLPASLEAPWMRMVRLPKLSALTRAERDALIQRASRELQTETTIVSVGDHSYVRLSAHMYNEVDDYRALVDLPQLV